MLLTTKNDLQDIHVIIRIDFMPCGASVIAFTYQVMLKCHAAV
jgi:hypothetical protein